MRKPTRREFIAAGVIAPLALSVGRARAQPVQGLDRFLIPTPPCDDKDDKTTPPVMEGPYFKPKSPRRSTLRGPGVSGAALTLTGTVTGLTCGRVKGALVDVWQADSAGQYDATGFRLRGHQLTDASGRYRLETIVPGAYADRARHLHVKVQAPGKPVLTTQLFFPDEAANKLDKLFKPALLIAMRTTGDGLAGTFNFVLDI